MVLYDGLGRVVVGAEDYNKYVLGVVDLPGVYFGGDYYTKKILESEKTLTVDFEQFDSNCKLVPLSDVGLTPFTTGSSYSAGIPSAYQVYQAVNGQEGKSIAQEDWDNSFKNHVYQYCPAAKSYRTWAFGFGFVWQMVTFSFTNKQGINYWCPSPGKISYNTGASMEKRWQEYANIYSGDYGSGDTYCGISWLKLRCLVLGRL